VVCSVPCEGAWTGEVTGKRGADLDVEVRELPDQPDCS